MKKTLTLIALLISLYCNAQTIETKSSCDSNADGQVTVADVTNTANKVIGKAATEKQVVTAEDLNALLQLINEKLEKLSALESRLNSLEAMNYFMAEKMGLPYNNGHEYVDLGLPSGLKWATMNVGATEVAGSKINSHTGQLDCYGEYYAWGETSPKDSYDGSTYTFYNRLDYSLTKYCTDSSNGIVDNKTELELYDDAAFVNWGGTWRMPTVTENEELLSNCYWEWTDCYNNSGVTGYIVYKVKNDSDKGKIYNAGKYSQTPTAIYSLNDPHIFLPTAGCSSDGRFCFVDSNGEYWSSSLDSHNSLDSFYAYQLSLSSDGVGWCGRIRSYGQSVRAVCP